jgi:hypothetical protein
MSSPATTPAAGRGGRYAERQPHGLVWFAVVVVALNALAQMFFIPAYPFWSLLIIAVDVVALWGLCVYGGGENLEAA